jgi:hypothetical protein
VIFPHSVDATGDWCSRGFQFYCGDWICGAGVGVVDRLDLNKRGKRNLNLLGVGDAIGLAVGVGDISAVVRLRMRLGVGEATPLDSPAEPDAVLFGVGLASGFSRV